MSTNLETGLTELKINNARIIIDRVLAREGGIQEPTKTEPYRTYWGQTPQFLKDYDLPVPSTAQEAGDNYLTWLKLIGLIDICKEHPDLLADNVIDFAVHSGSVKSVGTLQEILNTWYGEKLDIDGLYGPKTNAAVNDFYDYRDDIARKVFTSRMNYLAELITSDPKIYASSAKGWFNRLSGLVG
jgi:lysozyme family protein